MVFPLGAVRAQDDTIISPFVNRIHITGNSEISTKELKKQMRTKEPSFFAVFNKPRFSRVFLRRDLAHLEGYYHAIGFFDARVLLDRVEYSDDGRYVDVYIEINEGRPTVVKSVSFSEGALIADKELRKGLLLEEDDPYNASLLATDVHTVKGKYFNRGYLGVAVYDSVRITGYDVQIHYRIDPGTQIRIASIKITGNETVKSHVVDKELTIKTGEICRLDKILETKRNLYETGLFTVVEVTPVNLDPLERTVDLSVRLRERKPAYVEFGFGVGNIVGSRVLGEWGTRNLYGTGRTLRFRVEYAYDLFGGEQIDFGNLQLRNIYYRYDVFFQQRRFFGTKLNTGIDMFLERDATVKDIVIRTLGGAIGASRRFGRNTEVLSGFTIEEIERQVTVRDSVGNALRDSVEESSSHIIGVSASHDMRDFVLNPQTGRYQIIRAQIGGGILGGKNDFYTATVSFQRYSQLEPGLVFAWRLRVGYGDSYGRSTNVPLENRYYLGGGNSVRGYNENVLGPRDPNTGLAVGGEFLLLANVELRFQLPYISRWHFSGALFLDSGNVWRNIDEVQGSDFRLTAPPEDVTTADYRYSVGIGLRYNTPIGPVRLDYGWPIKQDNVLDDSGRIHLTLGQIF